MSTLVRNSVWDQVRDSFSEEEKVQLRESVVGQVICPPCVIIDESRLGPELRAKILKENIRNYS